MNDKDEALRAEVYWEEFLNISIDNFEKAVNEALGGCSFFPKPVELYEFLKFEANQKYLQEQTTEPKRLEFMESTEEGKALAKEYLQNIFKVVEKDIIKPTLEGERAKEFEEKRKIAKEKAKRILG